MSKDQSSTFPYYLKCSPPSDGGMKVYGEKLVATGNGFSSCILSISKKKEFHQLKTVSTDLNLKLNPQNMRQRPVGV